MRKCRSRSLREEVDWLKGKVEVQKEVSVKSKNRDGGRSKNGIEQVRLSNVRDRVKWGQEGRGNGLK